MRRRRPNQLSIKPAKAYILGKAGVGKSGKLRPMMKSRKHNKLLFHLGAVLLLRDNKSANYLSI